MKSNRLFLGAAFAVGVAAGLSAQEPMPTPKRTPGATTPSVTPTPGGNQTTTTPGSSDLRRGRTPAAGAGYGTARTPAAPRS
jgi:hypothetical protein